MKQGTREVNKSWLQGLIGLLRQNHSLVFCLVIGSLMGATSIDVQPVQLGIDNSYAFLTNSLLTGQYTGSSVALTYGPLGFLVHGILEFAV